MAREQGGAMAALRDLVGAFTPLAVRKLQTEIDDRLAKIPTHLNEYGYDAYGFHPDAAKRSLLPTALLYRYYFRAEVNDIERVPDGRVMLICNHAGQLPFDGAMLGTAMVLDAEPPRICRPMGEYWIPRIPWFNVFAARSGTMVGTPENCITMLDDGEAVMVFPEGVRGMNKLYSQRYKLQRFGLGFLRLALETDTPIVPVALVGSEEQNPGLANLEGVGRMLGIPALPITAGFPLLGPLGMLPLPVKYRFYFGEPLYFEGDPNDEDAVIQKKVDVVKSSITRMFERGLAERPGIFR
ncbi:MAG: lysophospholipid acyltransferase family protein [Proteobacteria bacterium]|nr:lysophospholipid acyltransferase family protein [Pseudomonadota bacterium]